MIWILVVVLFMDGKPVGVQEAFGESSKECEEVRTMLLDRAKKQGDDLWAQCIQIDRKGKPVATPAPKPDVNQDGPSPDGKRRGSNT